MKKTLILSSILIAFSSHAFERYSEGEKEDILNRLNSGGISVKTIKNNPSNRGQVININELRNGASQNYEIEKISPSSLYGTEDIKSQRVPSERSGQRLDSTNNTMGPQSNTSKQNKRNVNPVPDDEDEMLEKIERLEKEGKGTRNNQENKNSGPPNGMVEVDVPKLPQNTVPAYVNIRNKYEQAMPRSFIDMERQNRNEVVGPGQTFENNSNIQQQTIQGWNQSTLNKMTEEGIANEQQVYREFRRNIQP